MAMFLCSLTRAAQLTIACWPEVSSSELGICPRSWHALVALRSVFRVHELLLHLHFNIQLYIYNSTIIAWLHHTQADTEFHTNNIFITHHGSLSSRTATIKRLRTPSAWQAEARSPILQNTRPGHTKCLLSSKPATRTSEAST